MDEDVEYSLRVRPDGIEELHGRNGFVRILWDWPPGTAPSPPFWIHSEWMRGHDGTKFCTSSTWNRETVAEVGAGDSWYWETGWRERSASADENDGPACRREYALLLRAEGTTIYDVECGE